MSYASGPRVRICYVAEVTRGTTPTTPTLKVLRCTSRNMNLTKNLLQSAEVRSDRQKKDVRHGFNQVEGALGFELSVGAQDDFLEAAFGGTWSAINIAGSPDLGATVTTNTFTRATGSFITDGIRKGDWVITTGFSTPGNNGTFLVTAVAAGAITVLGTLSTEANAAGRTLQVKGKRLEIGTTLATFSVERQFLDIAQYQLAAGVAIASMNLSIKPEAIVNGAFNLLGMSQAALAGTTVGSGSPTAAATNDPLSSFDGELYEAGTAIAYVTGLDINIDNGRTLSPVVGSKFSPDVFEGEAVVTGTLTAFFKDAALYNKFVNETESQLYLKMDDINGTDFMAITIPALKYTGAPIEPPATGPVQISMPFQALLDETTGTCLSIQRSNS